MLDSLVQRSSSTYILLFVFFLFGPVIYSAVTKRSRLPKLPWVGRRDELFSVTRANLRSFNKVREWLKEGYETYSQKGKSYVFPDFSGRPEIIIPRNKTKWMLDLPDDVLSVSAAHYELLEGRYCFTDPRILADPYHEHVIHKRLPRSMAKQIPEVQDELAHAFDELWGTDTNQWRDICFNENMMIMIARASNRMFVGLPTCRDPNYLRANGQFAQSVIVGMTLLSFVPSYLKPLLGPLLTIPNRTSGRKSAAFTIPLIKERMDRLKQKQANPDLKWEAPDDYITWHIQLAMAEGRERDLEPSMIAGGLSAINFAAIHTTVFTITMMIFDLLSADPEEGYVEGIREEVERVYGECGGHWDKQSLSRLYRTDSAIRESMRLSNFATRGLMRKVVSADGITNDDEGWSAPQHVLIATDVHSVHHDPQIYPDPERYDAFRFSRPRAGFAEQNDQVKDQDELLRHKNMGMITTSDTFLPFGHGRHACPGRFFVSHELKMLLAYMVMNYELEPIAERPANRWFGQSVVPPTKARIRVRRRDGVV